MQCYNIQNCRLDYNGSKRRLNLFSRAEIICKDNGGMIITCNKTIHTQAQSKLL